MIAGAILAGGRSTRMGSPKEGVLMPDGRPMIEHVIAALEGLCSPLIIVGDCRGWSPDKRARLVQLPDRFPGEGPLGALVTLLSSGIAPAYLVVSCDQALLTAAVLAPLIRQIPPYPTFYQSLDSCELDPLPGLFPATWLSVAESAFNGGERSPRRAIRDGDQSFIDLPESDVRYLRSLNTPEDLKNIDLPS